MLETNVLDMPTVSINFSLPIGRVENWSEKRKSPKQKHFEIGFSPMISISVTIFPLISAVAHSEVWRLLEGGVYWRAALISKLRF